MEMLASSNSSKTHGAEGWKLSFLCLPFSFFSFAKIFKAFILIILISSCESFSLASALFRFI